MDRTLIFDVGCHKGEDSEFYLAKGFKVVAVEANPELCKEIRAKFATQIEYGTFILVDKAIGEREGRTPFYVNSDFSDWGTTRPEWAARNEYLGTRSKRIEVESVTFSSLLRRFGRPYYLKIDIEGADILCLKDLLLFRNRPQYVSIESDKRSWCALRREMNLFRQLGYSKFKVVDQKEVPSQVPPEPPREGRFVRQKFVFGSTGLFGEEAPGAWLTRRELLAKYRRIFLRYWLSGDFGILRNKPLLHSVMERFPASWYDTHAALAESAFGCGLLPGMAWMAPAPFCPTSDIGTD